MTRRNFLQITAAISAARTTSASAQNAKPRAPRILLRSSWQTVNIGDIAHTPGVLALLEKYLPYAEVRLWPSKVDNGVAEMLRQRFPRVKIVQGAEIETAFGECDFLLHGLGASIVAEKDLLRWHRETGKPYGIYGVTLSAASKSEITREVVDGARFVYFRDSVSLQWAKTQNFTCPILELGQDGAFAVDVRDNAAAEEFLRANDLETGQFLCCIPRLRYTPYWKIKSYVAFDEAKHARNEAMKEHDHAPLRAAIIALARQTALKVLLCPEDQSQMEVGREMLLEKLPADVRAKVVWRENYWLTGEALSVYVRSAGLFGLEMHSPIMCIGNGIPAIVGRFAEQTSKGWMWRDIGLGEWLFDFDREAEIARFVPTVLALARDPESAKIKANAARERVMNRFRETMAVVANCVA